ncbi:DUF4240 domain-containing protein [Bacillus bombysepticus]|uniref:DUF4240 domain-containing protein n=1 Tax=Bacillus bombysepticus TaxID=658666 RepID=UPI00301889EF
MTKTLWQVVAQSKKGKAFVTSRTQSRNLQKVLETIDEENIAKIYGEWQSIAKRWNNDAEFDKLLKENGGFVDARDDDFYVSFANWLVAQGEEVFNAFQERGHTAVIEYKKQHKIQSRDYLFEGMIKPFRPYIS